jgi:hypothetical protein
MSIYSPARLVEYKVPESVKDSLLSGLLVMKEYDSKFRKTLQDDYLTKIFSMQLRHEIAQRAKQKLQVRLAVTIIINGLTNRIKFATAQKKRLQSNYAIVSSQNLWESLVQEVDAELDHVIKVTAHFVEYDDYLHHLLYKASHEFKDDIKNIGKIHVVVANE